MRMCIFISDVSIFNTCYTHTHCTIRMLHTHIVLFSCHTHILSCIPVVIADQMDYPFPNIINWSEFVVRVPEAAWVEQPVCVVCVCVVCNG
jgi:hypothetical protein